MTDDLESRAQERVGTQLADKWTLERLLGVGGMAAVYAGRHRNGARAAVKVLHPMFARVSEVRERFLREGYAANRVEHPGVVKVLDDDVIAEGPDAGTTFLVMELLEGESLQDRLERPPPMGEREFLLVAEGILDVLVAAHAKGVVHRDLKPENLFLVRDEEGTSERPRVKVLDFGLARLLDGQTITSHGLALGTPSFMSPEQAAGRIDEIDGRTDLFALGATGFRVRTGRRIHEGANAVELVTKMGTLAAPRIRILAPEVSEGYARVVDRALEFRREDRYPDAAAMREDVRRAIAELDGSARTEFALESPVKSSPATSERATDLPPEGEKTVELSGSDLEPSLPVITPPPTRRRRSILPWIALGLFGAIGVKLWLEHRAGEAPTAEITPAPSASAASPPGPAPSISAVAAVTASEPAAPAEPEPSSAAASSESADEPAPSASMALVTLPPPPTPPSTAAVMRPRAPPKVGPGNVHKLPWKRHKNGR